MTGSLNIEFTIHVWREGNQFIAHAMPLDVMSSGNTPDEAKKALEEAVYLFVQTASDTGTLDEILDECGYDDTIRIISAREASKGERRIYEEG